MTTTTSNMNLVLPDVSITTGPQWATLLNAAYTLIDSHDHSTGKGVAITPAGLNISSDLTFAQNNATNLRSARFYNNSTFSAGVNDKSCLYVLNDDIHYIDGSGNDIQITSGGALNVSLTLSSLTLKDSTFTLQYFGDTTKQMKFSAASITSGQTRTYTMPDVNDTLVSLTASQTLTNKVLTGNTAANLISSAGTLTLNTSGTITVPNATDTLIGKATSDTLTNKVLTGNTAANLKPDGVNTLSLPAITDTVVTRTNTESLTNKTIGSGNVLSGATATNLVSGSGTLTLNTTGTITVPNGTDTLVGKATTDTLTNKTLTSPVVTGLQVSDYEELTNTTAPSTPASGKSRVYVNSSDGQLHLITSSGVDTAIGSAGSSGKNYLQTYNTFDVDPSSGMVTTLTSTGNRTSNTTVWGANTTALLSQDTTSKLRGTNSAKLVNGSSSSNFIESPMFTLDGIDVNTNQLFISFDMYESDASAAAGDWTVVVIRYNSSGTYQETITPSITNIPTSYYSFKCAFSHSTTSTDQYSIRWKSNTASSRTLYIDNLVVGPQSVLDANATGPWVSFTPTYSAGFGTVTNASGFYRRVGDSMEIQCSGTTGTVAASLATITIPLSLNIDSSKLSLSNTSGNDGPIVGFGVDANASASRRFNIVTATGTSTTLVYIAALDVSSASHLTPANGSSVFANTINFGMRFTVPISTWTSTVTLAQSPQIEYAYNTSGLTTAGASDTTSFGYGAGGAAIGSINSTTVSGNSKTAMRVRFQNPVQSTDRVILEVQASGSGPWIPASMADTIGVADQGAGSYGVRVQQVSSSSTDFDVYFGNGGRTSSNATYANAGATWSGISTWRWRVAKYSAIGGTELAPATATSYGSVSGGTVPGSTSGSAIATGYLGEEISSAITSLTNITTTATYQDMTSITLTAGVWDITLSAFFNLNGATQTTAAAGIGIASGNSSSGLVNGSTFLETTPPTSAINTSVSIIPLRVTISGSTTYYAKVLANFSLGNPRFACKIRAVRVG